MTDTDIIEKVKNGDDQAFEELVVRYQNKIYNLALRMTGNADDAFDMTQEAFVRAWRGLETFQFESSFSTWLYRLASNLCIDFLRSQKRRRTVPLVFEEDGEEKQYDLPDPHPEPEAVVLAAEEQRVLEQALNELEPEYRQIITMRVIDDLSYTQIAQILGVKEGTVKSRLSRARERLRKKVLQIGNKSIHKTSTKTERRMRNDL